MYDSRTDRADYSGDEWDTDTPWHYRDQTGGRGASVRHGIKAVKRATAKRNRRRSVPHTSMRGYGYGQDSIRHLYG